MAIAARAHALDATRALTQYVLGTWGPGDGLPSRSVHAIHQARDRYIWLGTSAGLARFDGAEIVVHDARSDPALGDGVVLSLAEGKDGTLYVGTSDGAFRYRNSVFERLRARTVGGVFSLLVTRDEAVWMGSLGRPFRWVNGRPEPFASSPIRPLAMIEDPDGTVWIGSGTQGLLRHSEGRVTRLGAGGDAVQALHRDRSGALWLGTRNGLVRLHQGHETRFTPADGLPHHDVTAVLQDRDGNVWAGTAGGGLGRLSHGTWRALRARDGLADDHVRCLMEDDEGNLWIGTRNGVNRLSEGRFITYARAEGLRDDAVTAAAGGSGGRVWAGTAAGDVTRLHGSSARHFRLPGTGGGAVVVLHEARDGALWASNDDGRLFRIEGERLTEETPQDGLVTCAYEDDTLGLVFFSPAAGLVRVAARRTEVVMAECRRLRWVHAIARDRGGALWLAGAFGLGRWKDGAFRVFSTKDGLPHERVRAMSDDGEGGLWLATLRGLTHVQGETFRTVGTPHGLPHESLRNLLRDGRGGLWLASAASIFRVREREVRDVHAGRTPRLHAQVFDENDGLKSTETLLGSNPGFRAADGRLWFATARGLSVVAPAADAAKVRGETAPRVDIRSVRVDGRSEKDHRYPPGRGELTIAYGALRLKATGRMRFRHRLQGYQTEWTDAGGRREAQYAALPAGRYRFVVTASNGDGEWNGPETSVELRIAPPWHRRPTSYAAGVAALLAGLGLAHRLRTAQIRARFAATIEERARIARELHDTLAQNLTGMAMQMEAALRVLGPGDERAGARQHLQRARSMITTGLAEVRRSIWVLRAQATPTPSLAAVLEDRLSQLCAQGSARLRFEVHGKARPLSSGGEGDLLRIAHEAVTNAVRHASAQTIAVVLAYGGDGVRLDVQDDGCGFAPGAVGPGGGEHFGLVGMRERAHVAGGELHVESRPGAGTQVRLRVPYSS